MDLLEEIRFQRLLSTYEKTFGTEPPIANATVEEAITFMAERLKARRTVRGTPARFATAAQHA